MGGRLDATNALRPIVSVITPIDLDHQKWLGHSLSEIAGEKAGIIKPNTPVVSATQFAEAEEIIRARAKEGEAPLQFVREKYSGRVALGGAHQQENAALAVAALRAAKVVIDQDSIARGLASVSWPARFQRWDKRTIIDGAHNPHSARILAKTWQKNFGAQRATLVLAVLSDKDVRGICEALAPISQFVLLPGIRSARALPPGATREHPLDHYSITPPLHYSGHRRCSRSRARKAKPHLDHGLASLRRRSTCLSAGRSCCL